MNMGEGVHSTRQLRRRYLHVDVGLHTFNLAHFALRRNPCEATRGRSGNV